MMEKEIPKDGEVHMSRTPSPSRDSSELEKQQDAPKEEKTEYPSTRRTWIIMMSIYITMFLIALDKNILVPAIPVITDAFNSLNHIGWYGSSYMLTLCSFQLFWGRVYSLCITTRLPFPFNSPKSIFLTAIAVFEIGSAICGAAPSSVIFILGRAITGLGAAGMMNGSIAVLMAVVPLEKRSVFQGLIASVFGIASVVGPLLGGAFTEKVSWRWCFYINLPCGAVAVAILVFILKFPGKKNDQREDPKFKQLFMKLDPLGTAVLLPSIVCLILALEWGGTTYAWSSWRIVLLLTLFPVLLIAFLVVQTLMPDNATLPMRILTQRTIAASFIYSFSSQASMLVVIYYIPLFFQALKNFSPLDSGLATLPFLLSLVISTVTAGGLVQRFGYPAPLMIISSVLGPVGIGLMSTWPVNVQPGKWIGFQVLWGLGFGLGMQQPSMNAQIVLPKKDASTGVSLMFFGQNLSGAIFVSVAQNVFTDGLARQLSRIPGMHFTKQMVVDAGATKIKSMVPQQWLGLVLQGYRVAIRNSFYVGLGLAAFSLIGSLLVEWKSVKKGEVQDVQTEKKSEKKEDV